MPAKTEDGLGRAGLFAKVRPVVVRVEVAWVDEASSVGTIEGRRPDYLSVAIYAARSSASVRDRSIFGIFGCGLRKNGAIFAASKPGVFAILANGGAWSVVERR